MPEADLPGRVPKFALHDWDASFTAAFDAVFQAAGITVVRSAAQAPRTASVGVQPRTDLSQGRDYRRCDGGAVDLRIKSRLPM